MFYILDDLHAERQTGDYDTFDEALAELRGRAAIPWDQAPNRAPCGSWETCGRLYRVVEYDPALNRERGRVTVLSIDARGVSWHTHGPVSPDGSSDGNPPSRAQALGTHQGAELDPINDR